MKKKILDRSVLENYSAKNLKAFLLALSLIAIGLLLLTIGSYCYYDLYNEKIYLQIFVWLFMAFIWGTIIHSIVIGY